MALSNEDLLAISLLLDEKLKPLEQKLTRIEVDLLENNVIPRLSTIESCYTATYRRYSENAEKMDAICLDVEILKKVVTEHSKKLQNIS